MMEIGKKGLILSGRYEGWQVLVQDDTRDSGGFLIILVNKDEAFDDWVDSLDTLERYAKESNWTIEWEDGAHAGQ